MSKERELLKKIIKNMQYLHYECNKDLRDEIQELLDQPEQEPEQELIAKYREGYKKGFLDGAEPEPEQKPLTGKEISHGFRSDEDATNAESYWAGVALAEAHHGITGE